MRNNKYFKASRIISNISLLLVTGFLGFTLASFLIITFGVHRAFSWRDYWNIARYLIVIIVALNIFGWVTNNLSNKP